MKLKSAFKFQIAICSFLLPSVGVFAADSLEHFYTLRIQMSDADATLLSRPVKSQVDQARLQIIDNDFYAQDVHAEVKTRGQSTLKRFARKNYSLKANDTDKKTVLSVGDIQAKHLILTSGAPDPLLMNNMISDAIMRQVGVDSLPASYVKLYLNNQDQGLYLATPSPAEFLIKQKNADVIFRRRYNDRFELEDNSDQVSEQDVQAAQAALEQVHKMILSKDKNSIAYLNQVIDLTSYMKWMLVNEILENGDYSDEVFFYSQKSSSGQWHFEVMPWDSDDLFSDKMHNQSIPFMPNFAMQKESNKQLIFNYESRIDEAISSNEELLAMYFKIAKQTVAEIRNSGVAEKTISSLEKNLTGLVADSGISKAGQLDVAKANYNQEFITRALSDKSKRIEAQLTKIDNETRLSDGKDIKKHLHHRSIFRKIIFHLSNALVGKLTEK